MNTTDDDGRTVPHEAAPDEPAPSAFAFDRHLVLEQLGGVRGMVDSALPTVAFIVANAVDGLRTGIWAAVVAALLVFVLRLVRRESVQQAMSGLFAVGIAVAIAAFSGEARNFFAFGIVRNAVIGVVLLGSIAVRRPLVGVFAEFLAPSHLGALSTHSFPGVRGRLDRARTVLEPNRPAVDPATGKQEADPEPEMPWREDPRLMRAYSWLTVVWGVTFLVRVLIQGVLYQANDVSLLGTMSIVLGLPLTAVDVVVTLWVVSRLHRHRCPPEETAVHNPVAGDVRPDPAG